MDMDGIVPLRSDRIAEAAHVLARAFADDPGLLFVLPDHEERACLAPELARIGLQFAERCGIPLTTSGTVRGAAIWFPPGATAPSAADLAETEISAAPMLLGAKAWDRLRTMLDHLDELHLAAMPEPHWYLTAIGVDPAWQRRGVGAALMQPIFEIADRDGLPCYLESPTAANTRYYLSHGFDVIGETDIPGSDVHVWQMRRNPARKARVSRITLEPIGVGSVADDAGKTGQIEKSRDFDPIDMPPV